MSNLPFSVWLIVLMGLVAAVAITSVMLYGAARSVDPGGRSPYLAAAGFATAGALWSALSIVLASADRYKFESDKARPLLALVMVTGVVVILLASRLPLAARSLAQPDALWRLTVPQSFRVAGVAFLLVMALGKLPAGFAIPAGIGDIAIGVEATLLARRLRRGDVGRRVIWFNILGLVDLAVATAIAVAAGPGVAHVLRLSPTTEQVSLLPIVLIPTTMVPLAIALHVLSLRRIVVSRRAVRSSVTAPVEKVAV